jgi:hypothetical protein
MHSSKVDRKNQSVCFRDTIVTNQDLGNRSYKTGTAFHQPSDHCDSSTTLSSVGDIELEIADLEQEDRPHNLLQTLEKSLQNGNKAPLVNFRKYVVSFIRMLSNNINSPQVLHSARRRWN